MDRHTEPSAGTSLPEIVVGVDGSGASGTAVRYALGLAEARGAPVRLVHCVPAYSPLPPLSLLIGDIIFDTGHQLLLGISERARAAKPDLDIRMSLAIGPRGAEMVKAAGAAQLVVLGRKGHAGISSLATGSIAAGIAAHAGCPVRVVPSDWRPQATAGDVVVGIKDVAVSEDLVRRGFTLAQQSGSALVLLQAWHLPSGYEDLASDTDLARWNEDASTLIADSVERVRQDFAQVPWKIQIAHDPPAPALLEASKRAGLLLIGRHSHRHPMGHLGSVPRALMSAGRCPVEIGPEPNEPKLELDLALEESGGLLR